jgi:hypothetical protein
MEPVEDDQPMGDARESERYRLDPRVFPHRLSLDLSQECLAELQRRSRISGRSVDELVVELLSRALVNEAHRGSNEAH